MGFSFFTDLITPTKYSIPSAPNIDINQNQLDTTAGNVAAFDKAKQLASDYNDFMRQQVSKALEAGVPGYKSIAEQLASNFGAQLRGELSTSDAAASQRSSAARALGLGIAGSQAGAALTARDLGLRQYQVQQNAQAQAPAYLSTMAGLTRAPMYDFSNVFLNPMQRAQLSWQNQTANWNVQNLKNQMDVQPEPWMKATAGLGDSIVNAVASYYTMGGSALNQQTQQQNQSGLNWNTPYFNWQDQAAISRYGLG